MQLIKNKAAQVIGLTLLAIVIVTIIAILNPSFAAQLIYTLKH